MNLAAMWKRQIERYRRAPRGERRRELEKLRAIARRCLRRVFCFGTIAGRRLHVVTAALYHPETEPAVLASELSKGKPLGTRRWSPRKRSLSELASLQGLPPDFLREAPFTREGKCRVIGNGVPLPMGRAVAQAVKRAIGAPAAVAAE